MPRRTGRECPSAGCVVARALREIAALLALEPGNRFRARAYERGAAVVAALPDVESVVRSRAAHQRPGYRAARWRARSRRSCALAAPSCWSVCGESTRRASSSCRACSSLARVRAVHERPRRHDARRAARGLRRRVACAACAASARSRSDVCWNASTTLAARREAVTLAQAERQGEALRDHFRRHPRRRRRRAGGRVPPARRDDRAARPRRRVRRPRGSRGARVPGAGARRRARRGDRERLLVHQAGGLDAHVRVVAERGISRAALIDATGSPAAHRQARARARPRGLGARRSGLRRTGPASRRAERGRALPTPRPSVRPARAA